MFMSEETEVISSAILHYVRTPLFAIIACFVAIVVVAVVLAVHEIKNDPS